MLKVYGNQHFCHRPLPPPKSEYLCTLMKNVAIFGWVAPDTQIQKLKLQDNNGSTGKCTISYRQNIHSTPEGVGPQNKLRGH